MGDEIDSADFKLEDYREFKKRLRKETAVLMRFFQEGYFDSFEKTLGFELETWLSDASFSPIAGNVEFCEKMNNPLVGPELSKYNAEINSEPVSFSSDCLENLEMQLNRTWKEATQCTDQLKMKMLMIGSLPTLDSRKMNLKSMSNLCRYRALNEQVMRLRNQEPISIDIDGEERLNLIQNDVMLEAAATSLQVHLSVSDQNSARYFNASLIASAIVAAVAANSPLMLGKELWHESRIPLFEQALKLPGFCNLTSQRVNRVTFGSGYVRKSIRELFLENDDSFPVMLPVCFDTPAEKLKHLKLHNGTIWRWNRPIVGVSESGQPNLRIEHRVPSSGPSVTDVIANIALYVGLTEYLANLPIPPETKLDFSTTYRNFYAAAKSGPETKVSWIDGRVRKVKDILTGGLLTCARESLEKLGVSERSLKCYFDDALKPRIFSGQTGAVWQKHFLRKHGRDFRRLTESYFENQESGKIVAEWKV